MNQFARAWEIAGKEMERMRNERLEKMSPEAGARLMGAIESSSREDLYSNGLAKWQAWMTRWRLQNLLRSLQRDLIREELEVLAALKEEPEILDQLETIFQKHRT